MNCDNCKPTEKIFYYSTMQRNVVTTGPVKVDRLCNAWEAINIGTIVATVNGIPLNPPAAGEVLGDSTSDGGNKGEIYVGRIDVQFAAAAGGNVIIKQKIYITDYFETLNQEMNK
jgi:hypothetical protein